MNVTNKIEIHLDDKRHLPPIDVMQGDSNTRVLEFSLYSGTVAWSVPDGVSVAVAYVRRDGAKGIYDTFADGSAAISVAGNVVSAVLVPQALAVAGETKLTVVFTADGEQLATFCVTLRVAANPAIGAVEPENYINLRQVLLEMVEKAMEETGALPDFVVGVFGGEAGYFSDESFLDIQYAYNSGRTIRCTFDTGEQELVKLPLVKDHPGKFYFSAVCEGVEYLVTISEDEAGETAVTVTQRTVGEGSEGSGKDGGYYLPAIRQETPGTMTVDFAPSKEDMPAVPPVALVLPQGEDGDDGHTPVKGVDYFTDADKAEMVEEVQTAMDGVPAYWSAHLGEKVDEIWRAMEAAGRNKSAFFFYTDAHWWAKDRNDDGVTWADSYTTKTEPVLLKHLYRNTPINKTNFGGDFIGEEADIATDEGRATMAYIHEWRKALRDLPNHHSVVGNHDDGNEQNNRFTEKFVYSYLLAPEEKPEIVYGDGLYYYMDNSAEKTRYIYLDTAYKGLNDAQTEFVKQALLSTKDGWHIVVVSHIWYDSQYNSDNTVTVGNLSSDGSTLLTLFDRYNERVGDFADCGGWVEFCIGGHTHWDYDGKSSGGIPVILCESSSINSRSGLNCDPSTVNETAISAIIANYDEAKIEVIRIGRGVNREVELIDHTVITYTNVIHRSIDKDGNIFNDGKGWADNSRIGSGGIYLGNGSAYVTGHIEIDPNVVNVIRLRNVGFDKTNNNGNLSVLAFFDASFAKAKYNGTNDTIYSTDFANLASAWNVSFDGNNVIEFTMAESVITNKSVKYIAFCATYIGEDSIITINEEID